MSNNMAKIADARKTVEQLKLEVNIDRMMVRHLKIFKNVLIKVINSLLYLTLEKAAYLRIETYFTYYECVRCYLWMYCRC